MSFRAFNQRFLEPGAQIVMVLGIVFLCQPWNHFLHRYGLTVILIGLIGFMVSGKIPPEEEPLSGQGGDRGAQH
ncbi:MAG TPA: hypothetical protein VNS34_24195 [Rhizobiaceae bacterium]|nr:hypothetical protein [Rhizobiaceae bacterium]